MAFETRFMEDYKFLNNTTEKDLTFEHMFTKDY